MYNVRTFDLGGPATAQSSRDYYEIFDAIVSASIDLGEKPLDPAEWFRSKWEKIADETYIYYNGKTVAVLRDLSV